MRDILKKDLEKALWENLRDNPNMVQAGMNNIVNTVLDWLPDYVKELEAQDNVILVKELQTKIVRMEGEDKFVQEWEHGCDQMGMNVTLFVKRCPNCGMPNTHNFARTKLDEVNRG